MAGRYGYTEANARYRAVLVLQLRSERLSFRAIAARLGISKSQAHRDYWSVMLPPPADGEDRGPGQGWSWS
jgi:hypothetical protein